MSRRGFLKAIGAVAGSIYIPDFKLIIPEAVIPPELAWFATARETFAYDIASNGYLMRHDILGLNTQLSVDHRLFGPDLRESIFKARGLSETLLRNEMQNRGMKVSDLRPLKPIDSLEIPKEIERALYG